MVSYGSDKGSKYNCFAEKRIDKIAAYMLSYFHANSWTPHYISAEENDDIMPCK